ncbi:uncharacterized protein WM294_004139 isoform 1-T4 [Sarcoramphus papa]
MHAMEEAVGRSFGGLGDPRIPLAFFRTPGLAELDGFFVDRILPAHCWHVTEISGAPPRLPTAVWTFRLSWRADVSDSKATVTDQLCAIPVCVVEVSALPGVSAHWTGTALLRMVRTEGRPWKCHTRDKMISLNTIFGTSFSSKPEPLYTCLAR